MSYESHLEEIGLLFYIFWAFRFLLIEPRDLLALPIILAIQTSQFRSLDYSTPRSLI